MDLSGLKWPIIFIVVAVVIWLGTSGGVSFMVKNFTKATPGESETRDKTDEGGLTRISGFLLMTFRYEWSLEVAEMAMDRYGEDGAHFWYNKYRTARCYEKIEDYQKSYTILQELIAANAHDLDSEVPDNDTLRLRAEKLKEVHELP